jgi:hypothetical protein
MIRKEDCQKVIRTFRAKHGIDATDENVIATVHLMNAHGLDVHAALDQSSRSGVIAVSMLGTNHELGNEDEHFVNLATELGIDTLEGMLPFSDRAIDWKEYETADWLG